MTMTTGIDRFNSRTELTKQLSVQEITEEIIVVDDDGVLCVDSKAVKKHLFFGGLNSEATGAVIVSVVDELLRKINPNNPKDLQTVAAAVTTLITEADPKRLNPTGVGAKLSNIDVFPELAPFLALRTALRLDAGLGGCGEERVAKYILEVFGEYKGAPLTESQESHLRSLEERYDDHSRPLKIEVLAEHLLDDGDMPVNLQTCLEALATREDSQLAQELLDYYSFHHGMRTSSSEQYFSEEDEDEGHLRNVAKRIIDIDDESL